MLLDDGADWSVCDMMRWRGLVKISNEVRGRSGSDRFYPPLVPDLSTSDLQILTATTFRMWFKETINTF